MCQAIMVDLKANAAIDAIWNGDSVTGESARIIDCIAGFACFDSRLLIHPLLQVPQTSFAVWLSDSTVQGSRLSSGWVRRVKTYVRSPSRSPIHSLHRCSPVSFAVLGQNKQLLRFMGAHRRKNAKRQYQHFHGAQIVTQASDSKGVNRDQAK